MKKLFMLFCLLVHHYDSIAQNTFFKWYSTETYEFIYNGIETEDGHFILTGLMRMPDRTGPSQSYLLKIDPMGNKVNEFIQPIEGDTTTSSGIIYKPSVNNPFYQVISNKYFGELSGNLYHKTVFKQFSENLEWIQEREIASPNNYYYLPQHYILGNDNTLYLQSTICALSPFLHITGWNITKYDVNLDSLESIMWTDPYLMYNLGHNPNNDQIKVFRFSPDASSVLNFNSDLNYINEKQLPGLMTTQCVTRFNDTSYLLTGVVSHTLLSDQQHIQVFQINDQDDTLRSIEYCGHPDTILNAGAINNTAIVGDKIFVVGTHNIDPTNWPWQHSPTWIQVTRIDTSFNIIDQHYYGGDAVYLSYDIIATSDGGAFICGNRWDYNTPDIKKYHIFTLKVNDQGLITDLPEESNFKAHDAIVYPNPGSDYLVVQSGPQVCGAFFRMYDMQGRLVMEQRLTSTLLRLSSNTLAAGTYPWQIIFNNKVIESGKWVKER